VFTARYELGLKLKYVLLTVLEGLVASIILKYLTAKKGQEMYI